MKPASILIALAVLTSCTPMPKIQDVSVVRDYISKSWIRTIRSNTADDGTLVGLPCQYTVPSPEGMFQEMYYWDTFFTNEGLILDGQLELAKGNVDNMLYLVDRFGYMPNGTRTWYLNRSQPPYLSMMVERIYSCTGDKDWLRGAVSTLLKEYEFWQTKRLTPCGLNRYWSDAPQWLIDEMIVTGAKRIGENYDSLSEEERYKLSCDFIAEAESGWDFNPRFERRCGDFCPLDLNANLYRYESNFAYFSHELGSDDENQWKERAEARKGLILKYCLDKKSGLFFDYDYVNDRRSEVVSAALFSLLFNGMLEGKEAEALAHSALDRLEFRYGIAACADDTYPYDYQWSYPNAWPPTTYLAIAGLRRYGMDKDARRVASKYVKAILSTYAETGTLWEKYNVETGGNDVNNEYEMPEMFGWTAGTFVYASDYLFK